MLIIKEVECGNGRLAKTVATACLIAEDNKVTLVSDEVEVMDMAEHLLRGTKKENIFANFISNFKNISLEHKNIVAHLSGDNVKGWVNSLTERELSTYNIYIFVQKRRGE